MSELFFDFGMGVSGDMLTGALLDLFPDREQVLRELNALAIPEVRYQARTMKQKGVSGLHVKVTVHGVEEGANEKTVEVQAKHNKSGHEDSESHQYGHGDSEPVGSGHGDTESAESAHTHSHPHVSYRKLKEIVNGLELPEQVKNDVQQVYRILAEAEAEAHGVSMEDIHFHEVGTMDAIADVTAAAYLMDRLGPDAIHATPIHVGSGTVHCAHGILPVPAPATAIILKNIPYYRGNVQTELCTPTGAALVRYFVQDFLLEEVPGEKFSKGAGEFSQSGCTGSREKIPSGGQIGRGFGSKVLSHCSAANCVTAVLVR